MRFAVEDSHNRRFTSYRYTLAAVYSCLFEGVTGFAPKHKSEDLPPWASVVSACAKDYGQQRFSLSHQSRKNYRHCIPCWPTCNSRRFFLVDKALPNADYWLQNLVDFFKWRELGFANAAYMGHLGSIGGKNVVCRKQGAGRDTHLVYLKAPSS